MKYLDLFAGMNLPHKMEVGVYGSTQKAKDWAVSFGLGAKKVFDNNTVMKAKIDNDLKASVFADYKVCKLLGIQATVARQLNGEPLKNGFLDSDYQVSLKLKYDN